MNERKLRQLTELSKEARQLLTKMIGQIGVGHVGGSLSLIEALVYLYYEEMRVRPEEPGWPDRDRIVLSKGHAGPALYTLLAKFQDEGFIQETEVDGRKRTYRLTDQGRQAYHEELDRLRACVLDGEEEER